MVNCKKCKQYVSKTKGDSIQCKDCGDNYHKTCVTDSKKCDACCKPQSPKILQVDAKNSTAESVLAEINDKLSVMYSMKKQMDEMTDTIEFYAEKYQKLIEFQTETIDRLKKNDNKVADLIQKNIHLEKRNRALEERVQSLEQRDLEQNIEIVGMEKKEKEVTVELVKKLADILELNQADIESAWRVGKEKENGKPRPIVVRLRHRGARDQWLRARKSRRLTNTQLLGNNSETPIYINENVTKETRDLFWLTKAQLRATFKYIWIQNGRVLVKRNQEDKKTYQIREESDISLYNKG
ncbi:hypothetical protein JYU34_013735 [Plutella xylostella]|uniref:Phorbol-ester/DAG-type domain-containing protein n=1 Tax=Plutella xylostella TaxID=51655 RepID=A0ABQ7QAH8_PLUXY|nr:hypothetical protein JYU34_013735 [Plutella xylostella]